MHIRMGLLLLQLTSDTCVSEVMGIWRGDKNSTKSSEVIELLMTNVGYG